MLTNTFDDARLNTTFWGKMFMQNNSPYHKFRLTMEFFHTFNVQTLFWQPQTKILIQLDMFGLS